MVLEKEPKNALALRGLGHCLVLQKRPAEALPYYRQAIAANYKPEPRNYAGLGAALDMIGKHEEARAAYAAGLLLAPQDTGLRNNLAISYALSGDTAKAKEILAGASLHPASRPDFSEALAGVRASSVRRPPVRTRRALATMRSSAASPTTVHVASRILEPEVIELPRARVAHVSRKINADRPMVAAESSEILIVTGRASPSRADSRHRPAMSFRSSASTPEEAADEVLNLLELAARGPRFVWQEAQR
jgi:tetratricopeptide (TPR) repeat protein